MSNKVHITELVLRDGHQSLLATRMRTEDMLPICEKLDAIGYWSIEAWGGATFDACVRFLREDPWQRLRQLREALPNTPLQMLLRGQNLLGYRHYSDDVVRAFVDRAADNGMDVFRIFDALNDTRNMQVAIDATVKAKKHAQGTICYTTSPVHSIDSFVSMAHRLQDMGCNSIAIKDMAGLLTPTRTAELFAHLTDAIDLPIHLHIHATAGLAEMCHLKAIENGCRHIDSCISSLSGGASHPPTESMVAALRDSDYDTGLDLRKLQEIGFYFNGVRKKYHQFENEFTGIDTRVQTNQVPGGMISNLANQLKEQGEIQRMSAVLDEIPRVRKDLGYPPLVTPTSQIVGTQSVFNVLTNERYKTITNEVKLYLQGKYGKAPGPVSDKVRQQAIGNEQVITQRPADLLEDEMDLLREQIRNVAQSEEDVLTYAMFPDLGREFLNQRNRGTLIPEPLEPPGQTHGAGGEPAPVEFNVTMHGEKYNILISGSGKERKHERPFFVTVDGVPEEIMIETLQVHDAENSCEPAAQSRRATKPGHVTTSMPGTIVDILVQEGDKVEAGTPVVITEAMKMETEIQAPISGTVEAVHIAKGDAVTPEQILLEIE